MSFTAASEWFDPRDPFNTRYTRQQAKGPSMGDFIGGDTLDDDRGVSRRVPESGLTTHMRRMAVASDGGAYASDEHAGDMWTRVTGPGCRVEITNSMTARGVRTLIQRHLYARIGDGRHHVFTFEIAMSHNKEISVPLLAERVELEALRHQYCGSL